MRTSLLAKESPAQLPFLMLAAAFFFFPFLWSVHLFDWDEINFAESAREMLLTGNYSQVSINFKPFWEKPPLFFWLQSLSMQLFGVNEFAARFPNAVFGMLTLMSFYLIGKKHFDGRFGFLWALSYLGSLLPHLYFKSAIIDPVFNLFIFLGLYFLFLCIEAYRQPAARKWALWAGVFTGLAILTKGPVGLLLVLLSFLSFWAWQRFRAVADVWSVLIVAAGIFVVSSAWYALEVAKNGWWFFEEFIRYQIRLLVTADAGHEQPFFYHFVVVFIGCFPMSAFALKSLWKAEAADSASQGAFRKLMLCLFWVVMIVFTIVRTKIVHYSSMAYFPVAFLSAYTLYYLLEADTVPKKHVMWILGILGGIFSLILIGVPIFAYNKELFYPLLQDPFALASLQTEVPWGGWEFLIGVVYLVLTAWGIWQIGRARLQRGVLSLFLAAAFCLWGYLAIIVPKIEAYSQRPAISFYKELKGQDLYVSPLWFKSYAHYFYFEMPRYTHAEVYDERGQLNEQWLLYGEVDKPVYFVLKASDRERVAREHPHLEYIKHQGGFALYKRKVSPL